MKTQVIEATTGRGESVYDITRGSGDRQAAQNAPREGPSQVEASREQRKQE